MTNIDITLTDAAEQQMQSVLKGLGKTALRLSVREAGCSGLEYVLEDVNKACDGDLKLNLDGFSLFLDQDSYQKALVGLNIDFQKDALSSAFVYDNPNKKGECGCGVSFTI
ncbi:MAG: iron-sulfur cluster assembly accessory protein [Zetaproteobacteria bacterium]|nr:iron-sulfur cluster assembly accessory protein [Zetaproteobacteria bacterium]